MKHEEAPSLALLLIDVINDFDFPGGERLLSHAMKIAPNISALKARAKKAGIPVIYINDNFGKWQEDFGATVRHCTKRGALGKDFVTLLKPGKDDYYILKPQRSGFYETPLNLLLDDLGAKKLIVTGLTTDICVLYSANDAYMRNYKLAVPADCVCAMTEKLNKDTLKFIEKNLKADISSSQKIEM